MNLILKLWLGLRKSSKEVEFERLNNYANFTANCYRPLYHDYCRNLKKIIRQIKRRYNRYN
jgi:hypothetical protein